jgi:hypothetical protein
LTRADYLLGKLGVVLALNLAILAVPTLGLWAIAIALDPKDLAGRGLLFLPLAIVLQSVLTAVVLSLLALGASALARSAALAGALLVGVLVLVDAAAAVAPPAVRAVLRLLSVRGDLAATSDALFGALPAEGAVSAAGAFACLLLMSAGAAALVWRRIRAVDVVG